jgi:hypothetical protein
LLKRVINEGHFTLEAEIIFRPYHPLIAVRWLKYPIRYSLTMCYMQCKLDSSGSVMKSTLP